MAVRTKKGDGPRRRRTEQNREPVPAQPESFPTSWLIASYFLLSVIFFLPALMPGMMMGGSDYLAIALFLEEFATASFAAGNLPKWVPHLYGGVPFFANAMDIYQPVTLLLRLLGVPTHLHLEWIFIIHYFLAGLGMYLLVRELGGRPFAAYLAGLVFMFSGPLISYVYAGHEGRAMVATLTPLFLFALARALRTAEMHWFVLGGAVLGSAFLSNQIQSAYYMLLAGGLWALYLLWQLDLYRKGRALAGRLGGGVLTLAIGFAMAAINFLPFLGYVEASPRAGEEGGRGYEYAVQWSMAPQEIVSMAVPERSGILDDYAGENPFKLHTEYAGGLALLLLLVGAFLLRRERSAWFFMGLGVFALTIALGGHTPIYRLYYVLLPGTAMFRAPDIAFFLVVVAVAVLAGLTLERLAQLREQLRSRNSAERHPAEREYRASLYLVAGALAAVAVWGIAVAASPPAVPVTAPTSLEEARAMQRALNHPTYLGGIWRFGIFLALAGAGIWAWVRGYLSPRIALVGLAIVAAADLWIIGKRFLSTAPEPETMLARVELRDFFRRDEGSYRVFVLPEFGNSHFNYLTRDGVELVGGEHGNQLQTYNEFLGAGEEVYTDFHNMGHPNFLALANARYILSGRQIEAPFLELVHQGRDLYGRTALVYENRLVLPRTFLVPTATRVSPPDGAIALLRSPEYDPTSSVLLYDEPPLVRTEPIGSLEGEARVVSYAPDEVVIRSTAADSAYLVLTDNHYPGWRAWVNGTEVPVLRAYHTFRAVPVPPGTHTVTFRFEPGSLRAGFAVTALTYAGLLAFGIGLGAKLWKRRRPTSLPG